MSTNQYSRRRERKNTAHLRPCKERKAQNHGTRTAVGATKLGPPKIPPCQCGDTTFALVGSDDMEYVALKCRRCGEQRVFRVRGRKVTVLRKLD